MEARCPPGRAKIQAEHPEVEFLIVRVEVVAVAVAIDRRPGGTAAREGGKSMGSVRDAGQREALGDLLERHRLASIEQGDDEQRVGIGLRVKRDRLELGALDA